MARSAIFSAVQRALYLAAFCEKEGISTDEGYERLAKVQSSRRQLLKGAALLGGIATLDWTIPRPSQAASSRVVIVGAGFAGLTCAYRLQQGGIEAQVIEAGDRIGGRMFTLRNYFPQGQSTELGGEFIDTGHTSMRRLVRELGLTLVDLNAEEKELVAEAYYFNNSFLNERALVQAFRPVAFKIQQDLATLTGDVTYNNPNNGQTLDNLSIRDWLTTRGVSGDLRSLLDVAYLTEYGLETDKQSSLNLLLLIGQVPALLNLFGTSDQRFHVAEGNDSVTQKLSERLRRPVTFGTSLEAIRQDSSGTYLLTVNNGGKRRDISADQVVLALPFTLLRQVDIQVPLPLAKTLAIQSLAYGTNTKVIAGFDRRVWQKQGYSGLTFSDLPYQSSWETSLGQPGTSGILTDFLGGNRGLAANSGTPQEQALAFVANIDKLFPGAAAAYNGSAVRYYWPGAPLALGSYACYQPGQYTTIRGAEGEAVGNLFFCGEHTSLDYQGYMNGASETGERAASEVLAALGLSKSANFSK
jgi:monoamine oxidase